MLCIQSLVLDRYEKLEIIALAHGRLTATWLDGGQEIDIHHKFVHSVHVRTYLPIQNTWLSDICQQH